MAARVCQTCELKYPHTGYEECPVCGQQTRYLGYIMPDRDWKSRMDKLIERSAAPPLIPRVKIGTVRDENGRRWLFVTDLRRAGYLADVHSFDLLHTLDGIVEVQGFDERRARHWVEILEGV